MIDLYIGSPIEHESDRIALRQVLQTLQAQGSRAIVLANIHLRRRQIDLVVATPTFVLVVEAKIAGRPLRGGQNGLWEFLASTGSWKTTGRNYYQQALGAKNALHQAMEAFASCHVDYPDAALVLVTGIPAGSSIPCSDFKVRIGDIGLLQNLASDKDAKLWDLETWRSFASTHKLIKVSSAEAAFDSKLISAQQLLRRYEESFSEFYGTQCAGLVPFACCSEKGITCSALNIVAEATAGTDMLIVGPSGCGKTMLAQRIGHDLAATGSIPVLVEGKHFQQELGTLLNQEVTLLGMPSFVDLIRASRTHGSSVTIILDAFNECPQPLRQRLGRCLRAIAVRYRAGLIITSQEAFSELTLLGLPIVRVSEPDLAVKRAIADLPENGHGSAKLDGLLSVVRSGLEAKIIGQVGVAAASGISRHALFDAYLRKRLGDSAQDAISMLARIGRYLVDTVSFSMSVRDFDRLSDMHHWPSAHARQLLSARLLHRRGDRISFGHELYFNAFAAEAIVRSCENDPTRLSHAISAPRNAAYKTLLIGAIDNTSVLHATLQTLEDPDIIVACATGECGEYARDWANDSYRAIVRSIEQECRAVRFSINEGAWMNVSPQPDSLRKWSNQECALLSALSILLGRGQYLEEIFRIVRVMEEHLGQSFSRLKPELDGRQIALRSGLFAVGLDHQNSDIAISRIVAHTDFHLASESEEETAAVAGWAETKLRSMCVSDGQLLMLVKLCRRSGSFPLDLLPTFIRQRWTHAPFHLRLALLDTAQYCRRATDEQKTHIADAIREIETKNIWISTSIIEALKSLEAMEDIEYDKVVAAEIEQVLSDRDNPEKWQLAQAIYTQQFDHPYDSVYWDAIQTLPNDRRKQFLECAVRAKSDHRMFVSCMITDLAKFGDSASGFFIEHWTELPPKDHVMVQDAVEVFVVSHAVLGLLQYPLAEKRYDGPDKDNAMMACAEIYYWSNRRDLTRMARVAKCAQACEVLLRHELGVSLPAIKECEGALRGGLGRTLRIESTEASVIEGFPQEVAEISRCAIASAIVQHGRHPWTTQEEIFKFAINILGACGKSSDLTLLRNVADSSILGGAAVRAVQALEERLAAS